MKKIIFIETSDIGATYTANACRRLGYQPLFLCDLNKLQGDTFLQIKREFELGNVIDTDTTSIENLIEALSVNKVSKTEIIGVMSFLDSRLELSLLLAQAIGTKLSLDPAILKLKNKNTVQNLIPEFSPPSFGFDKNNIPVDRIHKYIQDYKKIIVKPTKLAGALGINFFNKDNYQSLSSLLMSQNLPEYLDDNIWLCQAFIDGPLYSAEGYVKNGVVHFLGVSSRKKIELTESQLEFPVNKDLSNEILISYKQAINTLIKKSEFKNGFFHIEFIVHNNKAYIIDANVGRLGGGPLGEMIPMAFNWNIEEFYSFVIKLSLFEGNVDNELVIPLNFSQTIGLCYGSSRNGFFHDLEIKPKCNFRHTLVLNENQFIESMGKNNWSWIGIVSGYKNTFESDIKKIILRVDNEELKPCF